MEAKKIGDHYLVEFVNCERTQLERCEVIKPLLLSAAREGKATVLADQFHQFSPFGVTGLLLLAESHISIHTWPELGLAAVDIFTCGDRMEPDRIIELLREGLRASEVQIRFIERTKRMPDHEYRIYRD